MLAGVALLPDAGSTEDARLAVAWQGAAFQLAGDQSAQSLVVRNGLASWSTVSEIR